MRNELQSWRKPYMVLITIIAVLAIVFGVCYHVYNFLHIDLFGMTKNISEVTTNTINLTDDFDSINVDVAVADVSIVYGETASVYYEYPEELIPTVELKENVLMISQEDKNIGLNDIKGESFKLIITVPNKQEIKDLDASISMGNIEFKDFTAENMSIDSDMGNIELRGVNSEVFYAKVSMGNIEVYDMVVGDFTADCEMGNIEATGTIKHITADCDMGNIEIETTNKDVNVDAKTDLGNCVINGVKYK